MLRTDKVFVKFNSNFYSLYDINLEILKGDKVVILGESGSGKTTLLNVLVGLIKPSSGTVSVNGSVLNGVIKDIPTLFIPDKCVFFNNSTVYKNLQWAAKQLSNIKCNDIEQILEEYGIFTLKDIKVKNLNEYQKFLLAVARGMLKSPEIIVIDDVTKYFNNQDTISAIAVLQKIALTPNTTLILATSNVELAEKLGYRTINIKSGSIKN